MADTQPIAPTDAEIAACIDAAQVKCVHPDAETTIEIARAVLAKWGTPPAVAERLEVTEAECEAAVLELEIEDLHTTPQPTQAQAEPKSGAKSFQTYGEANAYSKGYYAGKKAATQAQARAVPLTDEQVEVLITTRHFRKGYELKASDRTCLAWYRLGLRDGERAHGITGGQHGTE